MEAVTLKPEDIRKLKYPRLAFIDWLAESPAKRFAILWASHRGQDNGPTFYELNDAGGYTSFNHWSSGSTELAERFGGTINIDLEPLKKAQLINCLQSNAKSADGGPNNFVKFIMQAGMDYNESRFFLSTVYRANRQTLEWWNRQGKDVFLALKEKRNEERASVERTVLIGVPCIVSPFAIKPANLPDNMPKMFRNLTITRPTYTATVVKETDTRLYITDLERVREKTSSSDSEERYGIVQGRSPNLYVEKTNIMVDYTDEATVSALTALDADEVEAYRSVVASTWSDISGPILNMEARLIQAEAARDDMVREILERAASKPTKKAGPSP